VSVRRLGIEVIPVSATALMSTIIAAGASVDKQTSPLRSAVTISRLDAVEQT
jgi:hypothetical protein